MSDKSKQKRDSRIRRHARVRRQGLDQGVHMVGVDDVVVVQEGHEIGIHSWIHEANTKLPPGVERELTLRAAGVTPGPGLRRAS